MGDGAILDACVIGAGWSGLMTCKYLHQHGLTCVVLERRDDLGGVWNYSPDPGCVTVARSTETSSSRCVTEMSDYPMPEDYPHFPHHSEILRYLRRYADAFGLRRHIRFGVEVAGVSKENGIWCVVDASGGTVRARRLCVCAGLHQKPNLEPRDTVFQDFSGTISHSVSYKERGEKFAGKAVLVYGGGETASDLSSELCEHAISTCLSIPNGQWFLVKTNDNLLTRGPPDVTDMFSSILRTYTLPLWQGAPLIQRLLTIGGKFQGHGIEAWRSPAKYYRAFFNKSSHVLDRVEAGKVTPAGAVVRCDGRRIAFAGGESREFDHVLLCTGYSSEFPYLEPERYEPGNLYKLVFDVSDPTLAFVGAVRPTVGSIPLLAEMQARFVAKVFAGACELPPEQDRRRIAAGEAAFLEAFFAQSSGRIRNLVDPVWYIPAILHASGNWPNLRAMALRNPLRWWDFIRFPANGALALTAEDPRLQEHVWSLRRYRPRWYHKRFVHDWVLFVPCALVNLLMIAWDRIRDTDLSEKGLVQRPPP